MPPTRSPAGEGRLHARDGEADGVVGQRAAYDGAGDDLDQPGRRVDEDQDAASRRGQRGVQPLREGTGLAEVAAHVDGELEPARGLRSADRPVDLGLLGGGEVTTGHWCLLRPSSVLLDLLGRDLVRCLHTLGRAAEPLGVPAPRLPRLVAAVADQRRHHREQRDHRRQAQRDDQQHEQEPSGETSGACCHAAGVSAAAGVRPGRARARATRLRRARRTGRRRR